MVQYNNNYSEGSDITGQSTVAIEAPSIDYGYASGPSASGHALNPSAGISFADRLQLLNSEYLKGILFVLASVFFIFAVPMAIIRRESIIAMINRKVKRTVDILGACTGLLLSLPIWIVLPILIKLDSRGPIFYTQLRTGENRRKSSRRTFNLSDQAEKRTRDRRRQDALGSVFQVLKFRTMVHEAEKSSGPVWATKNDPRVTRLGNFLRKTRIDETPQFINVLRGDMSLVGPRPERPHFVSDLSEKIEGYSSRLQIKPGLTGLAQIENGYDSSLASVKKKVEKDLDYIRDWSLWWDIKIMVKTVVVVITGKGAY